MSRVLKRSTVCLIALGVCTGCESSSNAPEQPTALPPAVSVRTVTPGESVPAAPAQLRTEDATSGAAPAQSPAPQPSSPARPAVQIRLSAGVALPQSLPDGTSVLCSMDFQWLSGAPEPGVEYVWVVETGNGQRLSGPANVAKQRGTVQAILRGVRPDQGPFRGAIFAKVTGTATGLQPLTTFIDLR